MASKLEICNLALLHLGHTKTIASIDERSEEANVLRRFFQITLDTALRDFQWGFATKYFALNLVEENPNDEWLYSYRYPVDCSQARRIVSGNRNESPQDRIVFKIGKDDAGLLIYTDQQEAILEYTIKLSDNEIEILPSDFVTAFSYKLAYFCAPSLTKGDPFKLGASCLDKYFYEISVAKTAALNETKPDQLPQSEFIRFRE